MNRSNRIFAYDPSAKFNEGFGQPVSRGALWEFDGVQPTLTDGMGNKYWFIDTTSGNIAVTLPDAADTVGFIYTVKRTTAGANTLTVTPVAGNIDGAANKSMATQYDKFSFTSDGSNYWII